MKSQERRTLRRKKGEHFSHGQEVRVWGNHRREKKMVIIQMVSIHIALCCKFVSAIPVTNLIMFTLHLRTSLGVTEGEEIVKSAGDSGASITGSFVGTDVQKSICIVLPFFF